MIFLFAMELMNSSIDIIGSGPVGLYLAHKMLQYDKNIRVTIHDKKTRMERPQVIRIPFSSANQLPDSVKTKMWVNDEIRSNIFKSIDLETEHPKPDYSYWPFISVGRFQQSMLTYLEDTYKGRFVFKDHSLEKEEILELESDTIFIAAGNGKLNKDIREKLKIDSSYINEEKGDGIYLTYQNKDFEYYTDKKSMEFGAQGITYAASNNDTKDVQIYTYPVGDLKEIYDKVPDGFFTKIGYGKKITLNGALELNEEENTWIRKFEQKTKRKLIDLGVNIPSDLTEINIHYGPRHEYAYTNVVAKKEEKNIFFMGDSAGGTDYKFGLNLGRGMIAIDDLLNQPFSKERFFEEYQKYWDSILKNEFNQNNPSLTLRKDIQYKYIVHGRVTDKDEWDKKYEEKMKK
jgi:hypothetical protein